MNMERRKNKEEEEETHCIASDDDREIGREKLQGVETTISQQQLQQHNKREGGMEMRGHTQDKIDIAKDKTEAGQNDKDRARRGGERRQTGARNDKLPAASANSASASLA
jgi:hypothetical protein